ncbi:MAG: hypothetical protein EOP04_04300 [Proteobacteria bacterium]|nr:MAG: hypothetical protein EOP04_04300 [Pseudomonadota bacterium]
MAPHLSQVASISIFSIQFCKNSSEFSILDSFVITVTRSAGGVLGHFLTLLSYKKVGFWTETVGAATGVFSIGITSGM